MKFLIVDDEPLSRELTRALLSEVVDVEVVGEAENGADALAAIERDRPDALFLDIDMPGPNGIQTAIALVPQDVDIVFLTASRQAEPPWSARRVVGNDGREIQGLGRAATPPYQRR